MEGAPIAAANAEALLIDADLLADAARYGSSRSLAVLAFEESVKARTLGAIATAEDGEQLGFTDGLLRAIIYGNHRKRHLAGFLQHLAAAFPGLYGKWMLGMAFSAQEERLLVDLIMLAASANAGKEAGLYTDFDPRSGSWAAPSEVGSADLERIRPLVGEFVTGTRQQIDACPLYRKPDDPALRG